MKLVRRILARGGKITGLYEDGMSGKILDALGGTAEIRRASHVEAPPKPLDRVEFQVDLTPSGGPVLGGFPSYRSAVETEVDWINQNTLNPNNPNKPNPNTQKQSPAA